VEDDEKPTRDPDPADDAGSDEAETLAAAPVGPPALTTEEVRVVAVEAAVAAGLVSEYHREPGDEVTRGPSEPRDGESPHYELPDWTDPPTVQVSKVPPGEAEPADSGEQAARGPIWRQTTADWEEDDADLTFLAEDLDNPDGAPDESSAIAGRGEDPTMSADPFEFDFEAPTTRRRSHRRGAAPSGRDLRPEDSDVPDDAAWAQVVGATRTGRRHRSRAAHRAGWRTAAVAEVPVRRNTVVATATGIVLAGVAVLCFANGPLPTLVLASVILAVAAGETFGAVRSSGYRPSALLGLLAVPALIVGSYLKGPEAVPVVIAIVIVVAGASRVVVVRETSPVDDVAVTMLVVTWVGVLGSFAGLLLNPTAYPLRHGVAFLGAAVALTVAHDIGSFAVGSKLGRHRLAPRISPGKTVEGLIGGTLLTMGVAAGIVAQVHPFGIANALAFGGVVVVFAPLGDLFESVVKRDLGLKDMGRLLPAHGGVFDRIDAMLFVLPATYLLVRLAHIG